MSLSDLTWSAALDRLAVYTAMEDTQFAHNCETVVRAEIERLRASLAEAVGVLRMPLAALDAFRDGGGEIPDFDEWEKAARAAIAAYDVERGK